MLMLYIFMNYHSAVNKSRSICEVVNKTRKLLTCCDYSPSLPFKSLLCQISMYLPLHNASEKKYIRIGVTKLAFFTVSLPLLAFITCVFLTMYKDFESANRTHCDVPNIFPSISASIGNYEPQITIWTTAIYVHAPFRFLLIYLRRRYYSSIIRDDCVVLVKLAVYLNVVENLTLLGLTHWTSTVNYSYHEVCFKTFIGTSIFYMLLTCIMLSKLRRRPNITLLEKYSLKMKWRAFIINASTFALAAYCFLRHNSLCEPYGIQQEDYPPAKIQ